MSTRHDGLVKHSSGPPLVLRAGAAGLTATPENKALQGPSVGSQPSDGEPVLVGKADYVGQRPTPSIHLRPSACANRDWWCW